MGIDLEIERIADWYGHEAVLYRITKGLFPRLQSCIYMYGVKHTMWHTEKYLLTRRRAATVYAAMKLLGRQFEE